SPRRAPRLTPRQTRAVARLTACRSDSFRDSRGLPPDPATIRVHPFTGRERRTGDALVRNAQLVSLASVAVGEVRQRAPRIAALLDRASAAAAGAIGRIPPARGTRVAWNQRALRAQLRDVARPKGIRRRVGDGHSRETRPLGPGPRWLVRLTDAGT